MKTSILLFMIGSLFISCSKDDVLNSNTDSTYKPEGYTFLLTSTSTYTSQTGFESLCDEGSCSGEVDASGNAQNYTMYSNFSLIFTADSVFFEYIGDMTGYRNNMGYNNSGNVMQFTIGSGTDCLDFILTSDSTMYTDHDASCLGSGISSIDDYSAESCVEAGGTWYSCTRNYWIGSITTVSAQ